MKWIPDASRDFLPPKFGKLPEFGINKKLLSIKLHYFLFFAAAGALLPQMPLFGKQMGIPPHIIGIITAMLPILWASTRTVLGYLIEYCQAQRKISFMALLVLMTASYCGMYFLPDPYINSEISSTVNLFHNWANNYTLITFKTIGEMCANSSCKNLTHVLAVDCNWDCFLLEPKDTWTLYVKPADFYNNTKLIFIFADEYIPQCEFFNMDIVDKIEKNHISPHRYIEHTRNNFQNDIPKELPIEFPKDKNIHHMKKAVVSNTDYPAILDKFMRENSEGIDVIQENKFSTLNQKNNLQLGEDPKVTTRVCKYKSYCYAWQCSVVKDLTVDSSNNLLLFKSSTFWMFILFLYVGTLSFNLINCVIDASCLDALGPLNSNAYGAQRAWGTIGYALAALLSGIAVDLISGGNFKKTFTPIFVFAAIFTVFDLGCCTFIKLTGITRHNTIKSSMPWIVESVPLMSFLSFAVIIGALDGFTTYYVFWFIEDLALKTGNMDRIKIFEGICVFLECFCGEIFSVLLSRVFLKFIGYRHTLTFSLFCYACRLLLTASMTSPYELIIIVIICHGATFGTGYSTISGYAATVAPEGKSTEFQTVVSILDDGLGYTIGSLFGGIFYTLFGARTTFRLFSLLAFTAAVTHHFVSKIWLKPAPAGIPGWRTEQLEEMQAYVEASVANHIRNTTANTNRVEGEANEQTPIFNRASSDATLQRDAAVIETLRN